MIWPNQQWMVQFLELFFVELFQSLIFNKLILDFEFSLIEEGLVYFFVTMDTLRLISSNQFLMTKMMVK